MFAIDACLCVPTGTVFAALQSTTKKIAKNPFFT